MSDAPKVRWDWMMFVVLEIVISAILLAFAVTFRGVFSDLIRFGIGVIAGVAAVSAADALHRSLAESSR